MPAGFAATVRIPDARLVESQVDAPTTLTSPPGGEVPTLQPCGPVTVSPMTVWNTRGNVAHWTLRLPITAKGKVFDCCPSGFTTTAAENPGIAVAAGGTVACSRFALTNVVVSAVPPN